MTITRTNSIEMLKDYSNAQKGGMTYMNDKFLTGLVAVWVFLTVTDLVLRVLLWGMKDMEK